MAYSTEAERVRPTMACFVAAGSAVSCGLLDALRLEWTRTIDRAPLADRQPEDGREVDDNAASLVGVALHQPYLLLHSEIRARYVDRHASIEGLFGGVCELLEGRRNARGVECDVEPAVLVGHRLM